MPTPFDVRISAWRAEYHPATPVQDWLLEQAVHESLALDSARSELASLRALEADRAKLAWDIDRRVEAERLGARLHRDPVRAQRLLESTRQGCDWLIGRWKVLIARLYRAREPWDEAQVHHALDLYGVHPDVRAAHMHLTEMGSLPAALSFADGEVTRLIALQDATLTPLDALERAAAERGEPLHPTPPLARARRALDAAHRRYHAAQALLLKSLGAPASRPTHPAPAARPTPEPPAKPLPRTNHAIAPAPVSGLAFEEALADAFAPTSRPKVSNNLTNVRV